MKSFPHGTPPFVSYTPSASVARTSFYLANVVPVATASYSLSGNPGPVGASGSNATITGPIGPTGLSGDTGSAGLGAYLLSASWMPGTCYRLTGPSSGEIQWYDRLGNYRTDAIGFADTKYLCARELPAIPLENPAAIDISVSSTTGNCYQSHTTIAGATSDPCSF